MLKSMKYTIYRGKFTVGVHTSVSNSYGEALLQSLKRRHDHLVVVVGGVDHQIASYCDDQRQSVPWGPSQQRA